jgi:flagellar hook-associated protein 3 FlgL
MKTTAISTSAISRATRISLAKLQTQLVQTQKEVSTGRHADVGESLGSKAGHTVSLRQEHARLEAIIDSNNSVATRLDSSQLVLETMAKDAEAFFNHLLTGRSSGGQRVLQDEAASALSSLIGLLNTQINGAYLFAGINTDVKPIPEYDQVPAASNKQAVDAAFLAEFGIAQSDPAVSTILPADMQTFLDTAFADLFADPEWGNSWSQASDQNVRSRISNSELIETSTNANEPAMRKLAAAYTMVADLGTANLNADAFEAVVDRAITLVGEAVTELTALRADLGAAQQRLTTANERMVLQRDILSNHISALEGVDPYEASTRLTELLTQIETSYSMTARITRLTILNYL